MASLTSAQRTQVQAFTRIGSAEAVFTNDELDNFWTWADQDMDTTIRDVWVALWGDAAKLNDYAIVHSKESMSQIFKHVEKMVDYWTGRVGASNQVKIIAMRSVPPRDKDEPDT